MSSAASTGEVVIASAACRQQSLSAAGIDLGRAWVTSAAAQLDDVRSWFNEALGFSEPGPMIEITCWGELHQVLVKGPRAERSGDDASDSGDSQVSRLDALWSLVS
jgi:hypothetical protein